MQKMRLLFVCTGNVCRSPVAEYVLRKRLGAPDWLTIESGGTHANPGQRMTAEAVRLAQDYGARSLSPTDHFARRITPALLDQNDLILTMSREHRREVVGVSPRRLRSTFTVREFARLADAAGSGFDESIAAARTKADRWERLLAALATSRHGARPASKADDVLDPYLKGDRAYWICGEELMPALSVVERALRLVEAGEDSEEGPPEDHG